MSYKSKWYDNKEFLHLLYIKQGKTVEEIAKWIGISDETVRQLLIKHKLRSK